VVKLWHLSLRLAGWRMTADQLKTEIQLQITSGWVATSLSNPAKCDAQAASADVDAFNSICCSWEPKIINCEPGSGIS